MNQKIVASTMPYEEDSFLLPDDLAIDNSGS